MGTCLVLYYFFKYFIDKAEWGHVLFFIISLSTLFGKVEWGHLWLFIMTLSTSLMKVSGNMCV